jgi:hypothetical protein
MLKAKFPLAELRDEMFFNPQAQIRHPHSDNSAFRNRHG